MVSVPFGSLRLRSGNALRELTQGTDISFLLPITYFLMPNAYCLLPIANIPSLYCRHADRHPLRVSRLAKPKSH
ncbi:MAG: hypothetical protein CVT96_09900 [Bacteroidetes bacterium HGW-Bacteroidetes-13]|nr:MAG: hypothetical protein CVT96_09900 [Bacteroidetes bacterium HGW-Bacteroidetes-13]